MSKTYALAFAGMRWRALSSIPVTWFDADVFDALLGAMRAAGWAYVRVFASWSRWSFQTATFADVGESGGEGVDLN